MRALYFINYNYFLAASKELKINLIKKKLKKKWENRVARNPAPKVAEAADQAVPLIKPKNLKRGSEKKSKLHLKGPKSQVRNLRIRHRKSKWQNLERNRKRIRRKK